MKRIILISTVFILLCLILSGCGTSMNKDTESSVCSSSSELTPTGREYTKHQFSEKSGDEVFDFSKLDGFLKVEKSIDGLKDDFSRKDAIDLITALKKETLESVDFPTIMHERSSKTVISFLGEADETIAIIEFFDTEDGLVVICPELDRFFNPSQGYLVSESVLGKKDAESESNVTAAPQSTSAPGTTNSPNITTAQGTTAQRTTAPSSTASADKASETTTVYWIPEDDDPNSQRKSEGTWEPETDETTTFWEEDKN